MQIGVYPEMTEEKLNYVVDIFNKLIKSRTK